MRYYQNQVLTPTTATLPDAPYSKAAELLRSGAAVNDIPAAISTRDYRALKRRLSPEEADFFRKQPEAAAARKLRRFGILHFHIGAPGLNALRSKAAQ